MRCRLAQWRTIAVLLVFLVAGCGKDVGSVSGKITYKGQPLPDGYLIFYHPDGKRFAQGAIKEDGTYSIPEAPVGDLTVMVDSPAPNPPMPPGTPLPGGSRAAADPNFVEKMQKFLAHPKIPARYKDASKSGLTVTVKRGSQEKDFDLTD